MNLSSCGIDCAACKFQVEQNCPGCNVHKGNPFWGKCDLFACATEKNLPNCGKCQEFPCEKLKEWASQENPERIQNLMSCQENKD